MLLRLVMMMMLVLVAGEVCGGLLDRAANMGNPI